jgi:transcriptional regulator
MTEEDVEILLGKRQRKGLNQREAVRQQYIEYLKQYQPGEWVLVELQEGEQRVTIKNRLIKAADEIGYELKFARSRGTIKFEVAEKAADTKAKKAAKKAK